MGYPVRAAARAVASPPALTIGYEAFSSRQRRKGEDDATSSVRFCADQPDEGQRSQYDLRVRLRRGCPATPRHQVAHARQRLGLLGRILCIERPRDRRYCSTERRKTSKGEIRRSESHGRKPCKICSAVAKEFRYSRERYSLASLEAALQGFVPQKAKESRR